MRGIALFKTYNEFLTVGKWDMPLVKRQIFDYSNTTWTGFNFARSYHGSRKDRIIHYYLHDHLFERVWNNQHTLQWVVGYRAVCTPDFSTYTDTPRAYNMWQRFRSQYIGAYCQQKLGLNVIPTLCWSTPDSLDYTFDGIEKGSIVTINSQGVERQGQAVMDMHCYCLKEALERLEPEVVFVYGKKKSWYPDYNYIDVAPYTDTINAK